MQRIRLMVGEGAVQRIVERHDIVEIGDSGDFIQPHRVGVVDDHLELAVHLRKGTEKLSIFRSNVIGRQRAGVFRFPPGFRLDDLLNLHDPGRAGDGNRIRHAEFEPIPFTGIVAGGNHHAAVRLQSAVGEVAHRRRNQTEVDHVRSLRKHAARKPFEKRFGVRTHITADHHLLRAGELDVSPPDRFGNIGIELRRIDAADIICFENSRHSNNSRI